MLPVWLNLLLTTLLYSMMISLGLLILNLKIRCGHLVLIAVLAAVVNVALEQLFGNTFIKFITPIGIMICLYAYLAKVKVHKSAIAIVMGVNIYCFIESMNMLILYNFFNVYIETYVQNIFINIIMSLLMLSVGFGGIVLIKAFNWKLCDLANMAENGTENRSILTALLLFVGMPLLIYSFVFCLTVYTMGLPVANIALVLNSGNVIYLIYFFATCYSLKRAEYALEKVFITKANSSVIVLMQQFFEKEYQLKEDLSSKISSTIDLLKQQRYKSIYAKLYAIKDYVRTNTPADLITIPQLRLFFQTEYALAHEKGVDFILHVPDLSGFETYVDDAFIRMLKSLYENAFEAVESAEFKEIYSEIAKDDDGGFTMIIKNNGDILPSGHQSQPFKPGYTTKNSPDRGYGLYLVKKLIDYYQGSIDLRGVDEFTQITIKLPFKENYKSIQLQEGYTPIQSERFEKPILRLIKNNEI